MKIAYLFKILTPPSVYKKCILLYFQQNTEIHWFVFRTRAKWSLAWGLFVLINVIGSKLQTPLGSRECARELLLAAGCGILFVTDPLIGYSFTFDYTSNHRSDWCATIFTSVARYFRVKISDSITKYLHNTLSIIF